MPRLIVHKKQVEKVEIGSMNSRITIYIRSIQPPTAGSVEFGEAFAKMLDVWAAIEPVNGLTVFDGTNIERVVTHKMYIRYMPNINVTKWVEYKGNRYDLYNVENLGQENKFFVLLTEFRGDKLKPVTASP